MGLLTSSIATSTTNLAETILTPWVILLIMLWVLPWKGYALWTAARNKHTNWFVILLVINTLAILDIIYIFLIVKKKKIK